MPPMPVSARTASAETCETSLLQATHQNEPDGAGDGAQLASLVEDSAITNLMLAWNQMLLQFTLGSLCLLARIPALTTEDGLKPLVPEVGAALVQLCHVEAGPPAQ